MADIFKVLQNLHLEYELIKHDPVFTVKEADKIHDQIGGLPCKNLFLRNQKGNKYFLIITEAHKKINLRDLGVKLKERLSFASPKQLKQYLGLEPGSVSPFGLINDIENKVVLIIDQPVMQAEKITFHPNINTATVKLSPEIFKCFLTYAKNKYFIINM